jgi:hypothetical protein
VSQTVELLVLGHESAVLSLVLATIVTDSSHKPWVRALPVANLGSRFVARRVRATPDPAAGPQNQASHQSPRTRRTDENQF